MCYSVCTTKNLVSIRYPTIVPLYPFQPWPSPFPLVTTDLLSAFEFVLFCLFLCFVFYIPYMNEVIRYFCLSLSDLFHLVQYSLGLSLLLQMARFDLFFYDWVVFHYRFIWHLLYPFIHWWALKLSPYLDSCK